MAASRHHNISGEVTARLVSKEDNIGVNSINITNIHASTTCTVDLFIEKENKGKFYYFKGLSLPVGVALTHNINLSSGDFNLFIKLTKGASETPTVDVILN
jgi:hypothetical protein|tara:strand:- start:209 stop:511 length:303 start_codon:yes stop_codon:yes gene_type:complete